MIIKRIPVPREEGFMTPMYFKKAIMECDEEWAQNKKYVDTSKKGLRNSVPRCFPPFLSTLVSVEVMLTSLQG